jgi:hypothetical protein
MKTSQSLGVHFTIKREKAKDGVTRTFSEICDSPFRGKTDHLFAGKEMQQMLKKHLER